MHAFASLAGFAGIFATAAAALEGVAPEIATGPVVESIGVGFTVWAIRELLRLRRDMEEFRRESRLSRRVIAEKLGLKPSDLEPD